MCGIVGIISEKEANVKNLKTMLSTISYRGPDRMTGFIDNNVALGNVRLSIVDIEGGLQPSKSEDGKTILVFNGEIFNYIELKKSLMKKGIKFKTNSEAETLVNLYQEYSLDFVKRLNGQFAIAIWDGREKKLHLIRDKFGIRPLFWSFSNKTFIFASEIKSIFSSDLINPTLNHKSLISSFRFWTNVGDMTSFENIKQVPAGNILTLNNYGKVSCKSYWNFLDLSDKSIKYSSDEEYFENFREVFDKTLNRQSMSDVKIASYLSGGVDSTVVASNLNKKIDNLETYSIRFEDNEYDETKAQNNVVDSQGLLNNSILINSKNISDSFQNVVWHAETFLFRTAPTPLFLLSKKVHEDGIKVVFTGEGADEILLGYDLFREIKIREFWLKNPDSKLRPMLLKKLYHYLPQYRNTRYFNLILEFYKPTLKQNNEHFGMDVRWKNGLALEQYFSAEFREHNRNFNPIFELEKWLPKKYFQCDNIEKAQLIEIECLLKNYLLSSQGDRMSMAHGVEGRYPFLDDEFIKFCSSIPRNLKLRSMKDKFILRKTYSKLIPEEILNRPKVAYQAPDMKAFFNNGKPVDYVEELFSYKKIKDLGVFNEKIVSQLFEKAKKYTFDRISMRDNMAFTLILSTMLLNEIFVKKNISIKSAIKTVDKLELV